MSFVKSFPKLFRVQCLLRRVLRRYCFDFNRFYFIIWQTIIFNEINRGPDSQEKHELICLASTNGINV